MSEASPAFTRDQFVAWLHVLGDIEDDPDFSEAAEEHAKLFYDQEYLRNGKKWARRPLEYFRGYLNTGWTDLFFYDGFDRSIAAPVTPAVSQSRGGYFDQQNADTASMSRQDTPSNVSSATLQHILYANDQRNTEVQGLLMQNMTDLVQAAERPVGIPNKLAGGTQPSVKDFREFLESIVSKFSKHNCGTATALTNWMKDLRMSDAEWTKLMSEEEKRKLWDVIHNCIEKAVADALPTSISKSKDGLLLLHAVFQKVTHPEFCIWSARLYKFFNNTAPIPAANISTLKSDFAAWLTEMEEVRYCDKVTPADIWKATYKLFAHYKMIQDHLRDNWSPPGSNVVLDTLFASIPEAIEMTQQALQVSDPSTRSGNHKDRHDKEATEGNRPKFTDEEREANGICKDFANGKKCWFGNKCKFQHVHATHADSRQTRAVHFPEDMSNMEAIRMFKNEIVKLVDLMDSAQEHGAAQDDSSGTLARDD